MSKPFDVLIVGARAAGAATAMLLGRAGARVLVVDHDRPGTDTLSTHALMRAGVMQLHRWGLLDVIRASGAQPVTSASFIYGGDRVRFDIRPAHATDALYAPRRTVLDAVLANAAAEAGAALLYGVGCCGLLRNAEGRVVGARLRSSAGRITSATADLVIGADGRRSTVARLAQAATIEESRNASAVLYGYFGGLENDGYRWHWSQGAAGGIIPTNGGESCVFLALPEARAGELRRRRPGDLVALALELVPALGRDLAQAAAASALSVFAGQRGRLREAHGPGWALVGDAGYFKDPLSAHGLTDALRDAEILARAILANRPQDYPAVRDALSRRFFAITDRIAAFDWSLAALKDLHADLNGAMKAEQVWIASQDSPLRKRARTEGLLA